MPRPIAGTYLKSELFGGWQRQNRVVSITSDIRRCPQAGVIEVVKNPTIDGTIIAPYNLPKGYSSHHEYKKIGQIYMPPGPGFEKKEIVYVRLSDTSPAVVMLENKRYLSSNLYGLDENGFVKEPADVILKRIAFFNRAVAILIKEADIDPRILHVLDWPTTLSLLYLEEQNVPIRNILFTYPDSTYQGLFETSFLPFLGLTGQRPTDLKYYDSISLAKVGMLRAGFIVTWTQNHMNEVVGGKQEVGAFQGQFIERLQRGELSFLFSTKTYADHVASIDMCSPKPEDWDYIRGLGYSYRHFYERLVPEVEFSRVPEVQLYEAAESVDLSPYPIYTRALKTLEAKGMKDSIPAFKALVKGFGSKAALSVFRDREAQICEFAKSLKELSANWYLYAKVARNALFGVPRKFELLEAVGTKPILAAPDSVKEIGLKALRESGSPDFSDLLFVTMSGGLGQRLAFNIQSSSDYVVPESNLSSKMVELLQRAENHRKLNFQYKEGEKYLWHLPKDEIAKIIKYFEDNKDSKDFEKLKEEIPNLIELLKGVERDLVPAKMVKIPAQLLNDKCNAILQQGLIEHALDRKQDKVWMISVDDFKTYLPSLKKEADQFSARLLDQILTTDQLTLVNVPKGVFELPESDHSLFEMQARSIDRLSKAVGKKIIWGVMLSHDNKDAVRDFFESNLIDDKYFGVLHKDQVVFKTQKNNPIVLVTDKKEQKMDIVIDDSGRIVAEANGHGGFHDVSDRMLNEIEAAHGFRPRYVLGGNVENYWFNWQMGNIDFIAKWLGQHISGSFDVTGLNAEKSKPDEKMGIFARADHKPQVIEYNHPSFTSVEAYAYLTSKGRIYFVKDRHDNILVVPEDHLEKLFDEAYPPGKANVLEEVKLIKPQYKLIGANEIPAGTELYLIKENLEPSGQTTSLAGLGELRLEFRQGNTNIFLFNSSIIQMVVNNPSIMAKEEHKQGSHRQGIKIEGSIFGLLELLREFESLDDIQQLNVGFVEEARNNCFAPIKDPSDVAVILQSKDGFLQRFPLEPAPVIASQGIEESK